MLTAIPLTVLSLILYVVLGYGLGGSPWHNVILDFRMISGANWSLALEDVVIAFALVMLFFETLRSARPARGGIIANHIISTIVLIVYIVAFIVWDMASTSLFFILTAIALFDVVAGFTITIRTAQRDIAFGQADTV
jgi:hypothetical protein